MIQIRMVKSDTFMNPKKETVIVKFEPEELYSMASEGFELKGRQIIDRVCDIIAYCEESKVVNLIESTRAWKSNIKHIESFGGALEREWNTLSPKFRCSLHKKLAKEILQAFENAAVELIEKKL